MVLDKSGHLLACMYIPNEPHLHLPANGDVSHLSVQEILQTEQSFKAEQTSGAFRVGQR